MNVYRLEPLDPDHPSWRHSLEQEMVWACAPTPEEARALVAAKAAAPDSEPGQSPWLDPEASSCQLDPTMKLLDAGDVIRQDGSAVDYASKGA
jgi:hypothetical protein